MAKREADRGASVVDEATLGLVTALEVRQAVRLQHYVSLLEIRMRPPADPRLASALADIIGVQIRGSDLIGVTDDPCLIRVLLVAAPLSALPTVIGRITRAVNHRVFTLGRHRSPVGLAIGGSTFPTPAGTHLELVTQATALATAAWEDRSAEHHFRLAGLGQ
ncbi:MAG: hypothetical protein HYU51_03915 [Candidatus Rokubacteria bacterium]|nr:hypothetical protein [Candidatus Rokubacteria bacterium]